MTDPVEVEAKVHEVLETALDVILEMMRDDKLLAGERLGAIDRFISLMASGVRS